MNRVSFSLLACRRLCRKLPPPMLPHCEECRLVPAGQRSSGRLFDQCDQPDWFKRANNYFELFGIEPSFRIDIRQLRHRYHQLTFRAHPDRNNDRLDCGSAIATLSNAFRALCDPLERATHLLQTMGFVDVRTEHPDTEFLAHLMEMNESPCAASLLHDEREHLLAEIGEAFDAGRPELIVNKQLITKLRFIERSLQQNGDTISASESGQKPD